MLIPYLVRPGHGSSFVKMVDQGNSVRDLFFAWVQLPERSAAAFSHLDWSDFDLMVGGILVNLGGLAAVW